MGIYQKTHIYTYWSNLTASSSYGATSNEHLPFTLPFHHSSDQAQDRDISLPEED